MRKTARPYTTEYRKFGKVTVPAGTITTHDTALGPDERYNFVSEVGWLDGHPAENILKWDIMHYGLHIPNEYFDD